ncbi:glycosyltransferase family 2 protein [Maribacter algicola]|uniref:Glycosyltransferase family 2 protein n=1 Tax=Meishania litoralis TaxID=3434685 RepID=A0ACC7LR99_9FLAO
MNEKPKISVLVPVYNVDLYLKKFLNSLVNQTLEAIEIIIVNDASPDSSDMIISEFLSDPRIKYINKEVNEGLGRARQSAYLVATGEYIINLDPDDYIDSDFLEVLYSFGQTNSLDIVLGNVQIVDEEDNPIGSSALSTLKIPNVLLNDSEYKILLRTPYATWFKLLKKDILDKYEYSYPLGELAVFIMQFYDEIRVGINPKVHYYYRKHSNSMSNYNKSAKRINESEGYNWDGIQSKIKNLKKLPIKSGLRRQILNIYLFRVFYSLTMISWLHSLPDKSNRKKIAKEFKNELGFNFTSFLKYVWYFKPKEKIFLFLCLIGFDNVVLTFLKKKKK